MSIDAKMFAQFQAESPVTSGLPASAYNSDDYWRLENANLFSNRWVFVGFVHELQEIGDVVPLTIAGRPIFLIRNQTGIQAFENACRHRCLKIIDRRGNVGPRIRCPYHSWVYGLEGELRSTPYFAGPDQHVPDGFDLREHSLRRLNCETWFDWIWVNLSDEPSSFDRHVEPLRQRLTDLDFERIEPVATLEFGEVRCNWKLLMENFIEPYHVQFVHSRTTEQPLKDHYTVIDGHCLGSAVEVGDASTSGRNTLAVSSQYLTLFPNFVFGRYFPDQLGVHLNIPNRWDSTLQKRVIYITDGESRNDAEIDKLKTLWYEVHKEDHEMVERMQEGKASDVAKSGGMLSPHWETSVRRFQELALEATLNAHGTTGNGPGR